jgi:regulator of PEP synthase PpsR (kinase-PPPase family)
MKRSVFILSDRTGITAETLGHGLLTQFENIEFKQKMIPFIDTPEKARKVVEKINQAASHDGLPPLLFSTLIDPELRTIIENSDGILHDFFDTFINPLENELGVKSAHAVGRSHGMGVYNSYKARIDAVNFAQSNDDGVTTRNYPEADVILIGVSRSGKTPTCLYLALQYGIHAANYPLTEEDLESATLPATLEPYRRKLYGLTIDPLRLQQIRQERRPDSRYSSRQQCDYEVKTVEAMYLREQIPFLDTSLVSIEEIATTILHQTKLKRHFHG